jgi:hypothetical protein
VFVLRTNTQLNPLAAMLRYKQLSTVEQSFHPAKHLLAISRSSTSWMRPSAPAGLAPAGDRFFDEPSLLVMLCEEFRLAISSTRAVRSRRSRRSSATTLTCGCIQEADV